MSGMHIELRCFCVFLNSYFFCSFESVCANEWAFAVRDLSLHGLLHGSCIGSMKRAREYVACVHCS
jgi:hypothetical protein